MDGRILINNHGARLPSARIPELAGWRPGVPSIHAGGPVEILEPVSLIVPTFFNSELKHRSLRYLLAGIEHSYSVQEIILVASDGENKNFDDLHRYAHGRDIRIVESDPHNRGKSRNAGAAVASSPHLLFLDDDMLLRNWRSIDVILSQLLSTAQDCALFPRRHYAKFPLLFDPPMLETVIEKWRTHLGADGNPFLYDPLRGARDLPMLFCFPGCFMLIRREAFQRLNGFNEEFIGWGFEDTEFGLRAIRDLRVMNLFRQGEPLLHIDHPVSPYKSDEHNTNYKKFYSGTVSIDVSHFCRTVFRGKDFGPGHNALCSDTAFVEPFRQLACRGIPIDSDAMQNWCSAIARQRLIHHLNPLPKFIALHGSRAQGANDFDDDYDVLSLYCGRVQEFFVSSGEPRVEVECADLHRFEHVADHPAIHSFQGPMELAKIANARLLWGDEGAWREWSSGLIRNALEHGWCFWLVFGLGLRWQAAKYGPMVERYFSSLKRLRLHSRTIDDGIVDREMDLSDQSTVVHLARRALDQHCPDWRERLASGTPVFELQVPEVWIALHRLTKVPNEHRAKVVSLRSRHRVRINGVAKLVRAVNGL